MEIKNNRPLINAAKIFGGLVIVFLLILGIREFMGNFSLSLLIDGFNRLSIYKMMLIFLLGIIAFFPMCFYDVLIKRKLNLNISNIDILKYGWIINAITIIAGLGDTAGITLRSYFYKDGVKDKKVLLKEVSRISILTPSGLSVLCIGYLIFYADTITSFGIKEIATIILALYIPAIFIYGLYKKKKTQTNTEHMHILGVVLISFLDWVLSTLLFFFTLRLLGVHITFGAFFPIYTSAMVLGMVSMLPGAVGAFDLTILIGLSSIGISKEIALLSILLYRLAYYIIPLIIAAIIFSTTLWKNLNKRLTGLPSIILRKTSFFSLRTLVYISGGALLLSTAFPTVFYKIQEIHFLSAATELHFSKTLIIVVGFLLIIMAGLLKHRAKSIYYITIGFLIVGSILTIIKSFNYIATGYLIIVALILILSRKEFYKVGFVISWEDMIFNIVSISVFWIIYLIVGYLNLPIEKVTVKRIFINLIHNYKNLISLSTMGFILSLMFLLLIYLVGKLHNKLPVVTLDECEDEVAEFLKHNNGTSLTHLIYLKDKYVFFSKENKGLIQYSIYSNKLMVLGNPLGKKEHIKDLIQEFYDFADLYGYIPIFFEVSGSMLEILHEYGYEFMKLGEAAIVHLEDFTIAGQKMQKVRTCCNKITKAGYNFDVVEGPLSPELINDMKRVSDQWLAGKDEMGYSMGFFDEEYINRAPLGLVRDDKGTLQAFVTTMPTYGINNTFCSDLMRYSRDTPRGVMDYMFANLLLWGKENGYKYFNFGVSPLANVGSSKYSFLSERFASQIYYHGKIFYSFQGLKNFKGKYAHSWEPKFLAYKNKFSLPVTMLQTTLIVSNSKKKTIKNKKMRTSN
ncbi:bifunctional lysylphosphatidylglycerol flippase/synthetase MprF [Clostridium mediterraneense]|uniref:bifunctional lysylphosphatidylglycerol flippase/synthetase MprF n=1 Tax=Clostridium mediterraneense TaxID=1805472 RepID=UPI000836FF6E|nr:bifunctional lysylphosphatidylglycerol flippase/synthetase MprF [Clostridium mediterraneense]